MNSVAYDVRDILEAESVLGLTFPENLFVGKEPSSPDDCVTIFDTVGYPPIVTLDNKAKMSFPSIQIRVRHHSYLDGWDLINAIKDLLHGRGPETWGGSRYHSIVCSSDPGLLDWDANNRARFVANFQITRS